MDRETVKITVRMPDNLIEGVDELYGEGRPYSNRTEVMVESISMLIEEGESAYVNPEYDALVAEYVRALGNDDNVSAREAKEEILEDFPRTQLASELEPDN
jgi:Arc/MetJ-type ribon-helix-helix transcriptional regulator